MKNVPLQSIVERLKRLESELAAARERISQLEAQIETDPLLDILNRRGFERELSRSLAHVKRYQTKAGVIFVDLNNFKTINDRYGHLAGDAILKAVAIGINAQTRKSDVVGRFGGDEFILLLWNATRASVRAKAFALEKMIAALEIPFASKSLFVGASAGIAMLRADDDAFSAIERADADMYSRKCKEIRGAEPSGSQLNKKERVGLSLEGQAL
jgi:diguanylate cyclase (GGDEF)-like protein